MVGLDNKVRARRVSRALGASALAIGAVLATSAAAQCTPDPTQANGTTTCTGTDPDGVRVTTSGTTVNVLAGAAVNASTRAAIGIDVPTSSYGSTVDTVNVSGKVTGTGQAGVSLNTNNGSATLTLNVAAGGSITGNNALLLTQSANTYGSGLINLDNSGTLTGSGGAALLANGNGLGFGTITNRASGTIGTISGAIGTLNNAGSINGGSTSAIGSSPGYAVYGNVWTNTGTIRSASNAATVQVAASTSAVTLNNSGAILNGGSGAAIAGGLLTVSNQAGGRIGSAGTTAINASIGLNLVNLGTITGDVVATAQPGYTTKTVIDSSAGTVTGSLRLGAGDDTLVAHYTGGRTLATGFSGTVDGGGGTNTEQVLFTANTSVTTPIDLATNFQLLGLKPAAGVTATLTSGFSTSATVVLAGNGSVINRGAIATNAQAVLGPIDVVNGSLASFSNEGSISGSNDGRYSPNGLTYPGQFAVELNM